MFQLPLNNADLIPFAQQLGSDCAFFLTNKAQIGTDKGDVLAPFDLNLRGKFLVMIYPNFGISTQEAYAKIKPKKALKNWEKRLSKPLPTWKEAISNDFENSLFGTPYLEVEFIFRTRGELREFHRMTEFTSNLK